MGCSLPSEEVRNAFKITLGHEITHKENDIPILSFGIYHKFAAFVNEVHADFGGAQKMMNSSRQKLVQAIDYKRQKKSKDIGDWCHPSWGRRRYYAENYNFDNELIKQIAKDVNCSNPKIIEKACNHFEEIKLIP